MSSKILILDIETAPLESYTWGTWDQNVSVEQIKTEWSVLSYAAKYLGLPHIFYADTGGRGRARVRSDKQVLGEIWKLLDAADLVVAQNGTSFDIKKLNARFVMHGFKPYSPIRVIDTLTAAKRHFGFTSNKLAWLTKNLTDSAKSNHGKFPGFELWVECLNDNPEAWKEMKKYNIQDVIGTEKVYKVLRPWITNHPNLATYNIKEMIQCPKCGGLHLTRQGSRITQQGAYQQYKCQDCGGWARGKKMMLTKGKRASLLVSL
jgi:hypothetical protein